MTQDSPFPQPMPGPGGPVPPVMTSDQIMQHVDQVYQGLPQPVKSALDHAHTLTGGAPSSTLSGVAKAPAASLDTAPPPVSTADAGLPTLPQTPIAKPTPGPMQQELSRVTAPPLSGSLAHTKADTGLSGVEQIHNPFLRVPLQVLEGAFNTFVPGGRAFTSYIPGTESHHEAIVRSDTNAAKEEQEAQKAADESLQSQALTNKAQADTGAVPSEVTLRKAQAEEANARAEGLRNPTKALTPKDKYIPVGDGVFNAESGDWAKEPTDKKLAEVTEIDPEKGKALGLIPNKDGKYLIPNAALGELLKPPTEKPSDEERFTQSYLKEHKLEDNATNRETARKAYSTSGQAPQHPPQINVLVPNAEGGYTAQSIKPGESVAPGAVTPAGMNSLNTPTAQTRTMAETAPKVLDLANRVDKLVDQQAKTLGPAASRWNEFMAGKVGAPNPDFTKLRTDVGLLQTALMRMHVGARGGEQMMRHFQDLLDVAKQDPQNLKAALDEIREYAKSVQGNHSTSESKESDTSPKVGDTKTFPNGKIGKWDGKGWVAQ